MTGQPAVAMLAAAPLVHHILTPDCSLIGYYHCSPYCATVQSHKFSAHTAPAMLIPSPVMMAVGCCTLITIKSREETLRCIVEMSGPAYAGARLMTFRLIT
jgi:hypothetical protein